MATKTIKFDDVTEKKLLEFLQTLPHGDFSKRTKRFWLHEFAESERKKFDVTPDQQWDNLNRYNEEMQSRKKEEEIT